MNQAIAKRGAAQPASAKGNPETGGATISVASKLPMDLILHMHRPVKKFEPVMGGGTREYTAYERLVLDKPVVIMGCSFPQNKGPHQQLVGGYAITHGIPKAFWDEWLKQNHEHAAIKNGMIFAHDAASVVDQAHDMAGQKSNMERLDPTNLPKGVTESDLAPRKVA